MALVILLIFQYLFPTQNKVAKQDITDHKMLEDDKLINLAPLSREEVITKEERVYFSDDSRLKGSISLKGARFDDIILRDYKENSYDS